MPVAVKLVVNPAPTEAAVGLMEIEVNVGAETVNDALLDVMPLAEAVTVVIPCAKLDATPLELMVATAVLLDVQLTAPDTLPIVPSEYAAVAVKVTGFPLGVDGANGMMLIRVRTADVTDKLAEGAVMPLADAVIVALPTVMPVATPVALLILAIAVFPDVQATWLVMLAVLASVKVPVAIKLVVNPATTEATVGLIEIEVSAGAETVNDALLDVMPLAESVTVVIP